MMLDQVFPAGFNQPSDPDVWISFLDQTGQTEPPHQIAKGSHEDNEQRFATL